MKKQDKDLDSPRRDFFPEIFYIATIIDHFPVPMDDHFIIHPSAWEPDISSNILVAEYRIVKGQRIYRGTAKPFHFNCPTCGQLLGKRV